MLRFCLQFCCAGFVAVTDDGTTKSKKQRRFRSDSLVDFLWHRSVDCSVDAMSWTLYIEREECLLGFERQTCWIAYIIYKNTSI